MDGSLSVSSGPFAGRYTIERILGRGATATVYLARDTRTDRPVAIKVLKPELAQSMGVSRFLHEIKLTEGLHHPRILPVLDSGESDGQLYFVLPYMDGGTLRERLDHESQLPIAEAVKIACTVAEALAHAHSQGFIHRDVKPENILFSGGEACLADFGIARAIERSVEDTTTSTGIARGTPAYMSPEQASGMHEYDGRSDIYSLACVLYEMIAGMRAFMGPTTQAVIAQRFQHPPRELSVYRPSVSSQLEAVIRHAMQLLPADRYKTATEFSEALCAVPLEEVAPAPDRVSWLRELVRTPERKIALGAGLLVVAAGLTFGGRRVWSSPGAELAADTTRVVVFPLEGRASSAIQWRDDDLMHQALSRWRGVHVVDQFQIADGLRRAGPIESVKSAGTLASSLGAGRYIRGEMTQVGDEWRTHVALFDVRSNRPLYGVTDQIPRDLRGATATYARLADSLLLRGARIDSTPGSQVGSRSLPAVQAFGRAQTALDEWDLAAADTAFEAAAVFDPDYARASLWLAQVRAWRERPRLMWGSLAERAVSLSAQLTERERQLSEALLLLSRSQYAAACDVYSRLRAHNDRDFAAWFGLGQCRTMDNIVVADSRSPSGWRFRSSASRAMEAYRIAFEILPSVHRGYERGAFEQLEKTLLLVASNISTGYRLPDSAMFYGRPSWTGDSLALVPYPWQVIFAGDSASIPPGFQNALARRRAEFRRIAAGWSAAFPNNASAKYSVAVSLELLGDPASIDTLRLARRLATDSLQKLRLAAAEVVLLMKFYAPEDAMQLRAARLLADSLLSLGPSRTRAEAEALAPVAALSGKCGQIDALVRMSVRPGGSNRMTAPLMQEAQVLAARIAMGCQLHETNLRSVALMIERSVGRSGNEQHYRVEQMLLYRPVILAPSLDTAVTSHLASESQDSLLAAARAAAKGDRSRARNALMSVEKRVDPGVPTPDITLARARLWLQLDDPSRAAHTLDTSLDAIRSYDTWVLTEPVNAASLVSEMVLRGQLAAAAHDQARARLWANAAGILWSTADDDLKRRIQAISTHVEDN